MKTLVIALTAAISTNAYAGFTSDMRPAEVLESLNILTLSDLGVGENAYVSAFSTICTLPAGQVGIDKLAVLEAERSEYGTYLKVIRKPEGTVSVTVPGVGRLGLLGGTSKKEEIGKLAKLISKAQQCKAETFIIDSIESVYSTSELLDAAANLAVNKNASDEKPVESTDLNSAASVEDIKNTWMMTTEQSKIDDRTNVRLMLIANDSVYGTFGMKRTPTLIARCKDNTTDLLISTGGSVDNDQVKIRLDKGKAFSLSMSESTNRKALFFPQAITHIKKIWDKKEMAFQFTPYNSGAQTVTFNIEGLKDEITPLREACSW